jgi:hypothetical protein
LDFTRENFFFATGVLLLLADVVGLVAERCVVAVDMDRDVHHILSL